MATETIIPANTPNEGGETKIEFTPEQQLKVNELINTAVGRTAAKIRVETAATVSALQSDLDAAKAAARVAPPAERADANADVAALQAQLADAKSNIKTAKDEETRYKNEAIAAKRESEASKAEALNTRKEVAITNAAAKIPFFNVEVVKTLTQQNIQWNDEHHTFVVVGPSGHPRMDASLEKPLTVEAYLSEYAAQNKYLVRGDTQSGTSSTESSRQNLNSTGKYTVEQIFGSKSDSRLANDLAKQNRPEYQRLRVQAKQMGLVA